MGLLNDVRSNAAAIAASAGHVHIQHDAIAAYARSIDIRQLTAPELDRATHYLAKPDGALAYLVTLDAINFGSGYFPHLQKRPGLSGYFTVASGLKDRFDTGGSLQASDLRRLTAEDCALMFGQTEPDAAIRELMGLFAQALNDLGNYLSNSFNSSFRALVDSADGSAEKLAVVLAEMPFYRDVGFYKRAQLTAADLSLAHVARFDDLDQLTIFADNLVPHVLRVDGVLGYAPGLLERINREEANPGWLSRRARDSRLRAARCRADQVRARWRDRDPTRLRALEPRPAAGLQSAAPPPHANRLLLVGA